LACQNTALFDKLEGIQWRGTKMVRGLEPAMCGKRLSEQVLLSLEREG